MYYEDFDGYVGFPTDLEALSLMTEPMRPEWGAAPKPNEWTLWDPPLGQKGVLVIPTEITADTMVEVRLHNGLKLGPRVASQFRWDRRWLSSQKDNFDIAAYRVVG